MKLLYSFSALLLCFNSLIAQFYEPPNLLFSTQEVHQVLENNTLDTQRAWYLTRGLLGSGVTINIIDNGLYKLLPGINFNQVLTIDEYNLEDLNFTSYNYLNTTELPDQGYSFYHGDGIVSNLISAHNNNNNNTIAGITPNSAIKLCREKIENVPGYNDYDTASVIACLDRQKENNEIIPDFFDIHIFNSVSESSDNDDDLQEYAAIIESFKNNNLITFHYPSASCNNNETTGSSLSDFLTTSPYFIEVGASKISGEPIENYNSESLSFLAPGTSIGPRYADSETSYITGKNIGSCNSINVSAGIASLIISEMKDDEDGQDRDQRAWVKKMMTTTAEKIGTGFDDLRLPPRDIQDNMQKNEYSETTQRNNTHGHGFLNAHQSILLTKTFVLDQDDYIYTPIPVETTQPQIMNWDQVMFDDNHNKRYAMALNRNKISTYHLPQSRDNVNDMGGVFYDIILDHLPNVNNFQDHYMRSIQLEGPNFDFITHANNRAARVIIPFSQTRRLSEEILTPLPDQDHRQLQCRTNFPVLSFLPGFGNARPINSACVTTVSAAGEDLKIEIRNGIVECKNTTYDSDYSAAVEECINEIDGITDIIKAENNEQYFHLAKSDDPNGKYKKGDLVVSRKIKGKWKVVWASRTNDILSSEDHDLFLHRDITDKISYDVYGEVVTESTDLTDNDYMHTGDAGRRLLHHNGRLGVIEKNDQGTLDENDDIWREIKMLTDHQDLGHTAHRLQINRGLLQFVGGTENENGVFNSDVALKTFGTDCPNTDYSTYTNPKFDFVKDGRSLAYFNGETPIFLIDVINTTNSSLATNQKLIPINQQPNIENGNEVNSIISEDGTKASIIMDGKLKVLPLQNGVFCINNPIQTFDLD